MSLEKNNINDIKYTRDFLKDSENNSYYISCILSPLKILERINEKNIYDFYELFGEIFFNLVEKFNSDLFATVINKKIYPKEIGSLNIILKYLNLDIEIFSLIVKNFNEGQDINKTILYLKSIESYKILIFSGKFNFKKIDNQYLEEISKYPEILEMLILSKKLPKFFLKKLTYESLSKLSEDINIFLYTMIKKTRIENRNLYIIIEKNYTRLLKILLTGKFSFNYIKLDFLIKNQKNEIFKLFYSRFADKYDREIYLEYAAFWSNEEVYIFLENNIEENTEKVKTVKKLKILRVDFYPSEKFLHKK